MHQELAERIMSLLSNEEIRLGLSASGLISRELSVRSLDTSAQVRSVDTSDKKSVETSTRALQTSAPVSGAVVTRHRDKTRDTDFSTLSSEMKESDNSSR